MTSKLKSINKREFKNPPKKAGQLVRWWWMVLEIEESE